MRIQEKQNENSNSTVTEPQAQAGVAQAAPESIAVFGGTLERKDGGWYWKDGIREAKVSDLTAAELFNFRMASADVVEFPQFKVGLHPELAWVPAGGYQLTPSRDGSANSEFLCRFPERRSEMIMAYLVPKTEWDQQMARVIGVSYNNSEIPALSEKSRALGYEWPAAPAKSETQPSSDDPAEPLTRGELYLIADVLNGVNRMLVVDEGAWPLYTDSAQHLVAELADAMAGDRLDQKWDVEYNTVICKVRRLSPMQRRHLMLGMAEFWNRADDGAEKVLDRLRLEFN
jgi:hypothetical protein